VCFHAVEVDNLFLLQDETSSKSYNVAKAGMMDANYSLPDNVAIVTLQVLLYLFSPFRYHLPMDPKSDYLYIFHHGECLNISEPR